jgi:Bacterial Ig-like domain
MIRREVRTDARTTFQSAHSMTKRAEPDPPSSDCQFCLVAEAGGCYRFALRPIPRITSFGTLKTEELLLIRLPLSAHCGTHRRRRLRGHEMIEALEGRRMLSWTATTPLPDAYVEHSLVYCSGFLYQIGGISLNGGIPDGVNTFSAAVHTDGTLGTWNAITPLPEAVNSQASVQADGFLYVLGGEHYNDNDGVVLSNTVYYTKTNRDGTVGDWKTATPLPNGGYLPGAAVWNHTIYVLGGVTVSGLSKAVDSATIQPDGSLSAWTSQRSLPIDTYAGAAVSNGFLYLLGGVENGGTDLVNKVYYAKIRADNSLGTWAQANPLPVPVCLFAAVDAGGRIFAMGGNTDTDPITSAVYIAQVAPDGSLGAWLLGTPLPAPSFEHAAAVSDDHIFVSGGSDYFTTYYNTVYSMALPPPLNTPDLTPPTVAAASFNYNAAQASITVQFSEDVSSQLGAGALQLTNTTTHTTIDPASVQYSYAPASNTATFTFGNLPNHSLPDGNYTATLAASFVFDAAGNEMASDYAFNPFFSLAGDGNHDGKVNLLDLNALATNFGRNGKTFSEGDFNYDGNVNMLDFNALAGRFGMALAPVGTLPLSMSAGIAAGDLFSTQPLTIDSPNRDLIQSEPSVL